jgi:hypothetical protein
MRGFRWVWTQDVPLPEKLKKMTIWDCIAGGLRLMMDVSDPRTMFSEEATANMVKLEIQRLATTPEI